MGRKKRKSNKRPPGQEPSGGNPIPPLGQIEAEEDKKARKTQENKHMAENNQGKALWEKYAPTANGWLVIFTGVLAASSIYQFAVTRGQLRIMERQLIETQRALEVDQRPWLSVQAKPTHGLIWVNGKQPAMSLQFSIKNVGKTIAKRINLDAKMFPTSAEMPVAIEAVKKQDELCDQIKTGPITYDLFPTSEPMERELSVSVVPSAIEGQAIAIPGEKPRKFVGFYVVGCVTYNSSFSDALHQTRFAYHLLRPIGTEGGKFLTMSDGKPLLTGFEIGVNVPNGGFGLMDELSASNAAN